MKIKLFVVLLALISFSSCKKTETSAVTLDTSSMVVIKGDISSPFDIPNGLELLIAMQNEHYVENGDGYQYFYVPIVIDANDAKKATYTYNLPIPNMSHSIEEPSGSIVGEIILPPFFDNVDKYVGNYPWWEDNYKFYIQIMDIEVVRNLEYVLD